MAGTVYINRNGYSVDLVAVAEKDYKSSVGSSKEGTEDLELRTTQNDMITSPFHPAFQANLLPR